MSQIFPEIFLWIGIQLSFNPGITYTPQKTLTYINLDTVIYHCLPLPFCFELTFSLHN